MSNATLDALGAQGVIPVLRSADPAGAVATARAAAAGGMSVIELTCSTPRVEQAIAELAADGLAVGIGTVTAADQLEAAAAAGASFAVSFAAPPGLQERADQLGVPLVPGAFTPSEVLAARQAGAPAVKLFPARALGPAYLRDLLAVMPDLRAIATGGIALADGSIGEWLGAGAFAVGLGSDLGDAATHGAGAVTARAEEALAQARQTRES